MSRGSAITAHLQRADRFSSSVLRVTVLGFAGASGLAVLTMIGVTCVDVVMRMLGTALTGSFDIVRIACAIAIACALPYTTAVKGHVAIEYFFHKLKRRGRIVVDTVSRLLVAGLFGMLAWQCVVYGNSQWRSGEVFLTLQLRVFWLAYVVGLCCAVTVLVIVSNLLHPGREMIKP
ncbi:MAG: TRAP transporter small permease [bacterium]|nr:TRAP transporter small permease [bacterium]